MAASISRRRLAKHIAARLQKDGDSPAFFKQIAAYLIDNKSTSQLDLLVHDVLDVLASDHGVVSAEVISARELNTELSEQIQSFVREQTNAATVQLRESVDESLIGGVIIRTPDAEYDASVRAKLKQLKI